MRKLFFILLFIFLSFFCIDPRLLFVFNDFFFIYLYFKSKKYAEDHFEFIANRKAQDEFQELLYKIEHDEELTEKEKKKIENIWISKKIK